MKVTKKEHQPEFKPVTLELTFETLREYQLFKQWCGRSTKQHVIELANQSDFDDSIRDFDIYSDTNISQVIYTALNT